MSPPAVQRFDALAEILYHLPAGPFSLDLFLTHAIGLNAVSNVSDVGPMIERLAELGLIRPADDDGNWVVVTREASVQQDRTASE